MAGDGLDIPNTLTGCLPSSGHFDVPIPKHSPFITKICLLASKLDARRPLTPPVLLRA